MSRDDRPTADMNALIEATRLGPQAQRGMRAVIDAWQGQAGLMPDAEQAGAITDYRAQLPDRAAITVDHDRFWGGGWSVQTDIRGTAHRWMARTATIVLPVQLSVGARITVEGAARHRRLSAADVTLLLDDQRLEQQSRFAWRGAWRIDATVVSPPRRDRPLPILYIAAAKGGRWRGESTPGSLALCKVDVTPDGPGPR